MHFVIGITSQCNKPLCFKEKNNTLAGFEIDFINEIMKRAGRTCELRDMPFEELLPNLQSGALHMAIAGIMPTHERKKLVFFTPPYLENAPLVAISFKKNLSITSFNDLKKYKIIINKGHWPVNELKEDPEMQVTESSSLEEAIAHLKSNAADIMVIEERAVNHFDDMILLHSITMYPFPTRGNVTAIAISKYYLEIADFIDSVLKAMQEDASIEFLKQKWNL